MREFITSILGEMHGNAVLSLSSGKTAPTPASPNGKLKVDRHFWFQYPLELDAMVAFAEKAYDDKVDAYLSPIIYGNEAFKNKEGKVVAHTHDNRPLYARSKSNALFAQTIYMDSDACPPGAFRIQPSIHVDTSLGHGHDYWRLMDPVPATLASEIAHRITVAHKDDGCDPSGYSMNKVLRLPTFNTGYNAESPWPVQWADDGSLYDATDISGAYDDIELTGYTGHADRPLSPVPSLEGMPSFEELIARVPSTNKRLTDLIFKVPKLGPDGWRSEQRYALLLDLKRAGFTDTETIVMAWNSPSSAKFREDGRGVDGLWWELQVRVNPTLALERGEGIEPAPAMPEDHSGRGPKLLTDAERARVERRSDMTTLYLEYARSKVQVFNAPLHHANAWTMLAICLGDVAVIPKDPRDMPLNLYIMQIAASSTGKSEANDGILMPIIHAYEPEDGPNIGARHSKEALIEQLQERDGKVSFINTDEAHGWLNDMKQNTGPSANLRDILTQIYDGGVPTVGRVGKKETSRAGRTTVPVMQLIGPPRDMYRVLDTSLFYSGFLARMIWVIGEIHETTEETVRSKIRRGTATNRNDLMPRWWASRMHTIRSQVLTGLPLDRRRAELQPTDEAINRIDAGKWAMTQHFSNEYDIEMWTTIVRRMGDILWKIAGLRALGEGRTIIGTADAEVALGYAETWLSNAIEVANGISDTMFSRFCDEIESFIASAPNQEAEMGSVYRFRKSEPKRTTDEYIQSLIHQGRISEDTSDGRHVYKIKRGSASI